MRMHPCVRSAIVLSTFIVFLYSSPFLLASTKEKQDSEKLRADYIARMQKQPTLQEATTLGSLYSPNGALTDMSADYKAHRLGDVVTLLVSETTAASSTGDVNNSRSFQANSAIANAPGTSSQAANPLLGMSSSKTLKGQGETSTGSSVTATVSARVIAMLPSGSMIVEAERRILINSQHENLILRGVLRPGDVGPNNTASATSLANLEIELKGKGVVSDYIGRQNPIIRGLLWLLTW
ncbi:MAG: flagellar basal body L-ring protein FlgH [Candidatus Sulfotelmatobacter sp.]|jgi:flagellar L-ring protein FlgH